MWSVFFLVPVGRGIEEQRIAPEEYETVFERLWHHAQRQPYAVKTTEAPHYRRFVLAARRRSAGRARQEARDGRRGTGTRSPRAAGRRRRQGRDVRQPHRRNLSRRLPAAVLRAISARFGGRGLPEAPRLSGPARSRPLQGPLRHLRVSPRLRRQPGPGLCRHRRLPGDRAGLRLRAAGARTDRLLAKDTKTKRKFPTAAPTFPRRIG